MESLAQTDITTPVAAIDAIAAGLRLFLHLPPKAPLAIALVFDELQEIRHLAYNCTVDEAIAEHAMQSFTDTIARLPLVFPRPAVGGDLFLVPFFFGTTSAPAMSADAPSIVDLPFPSLTHDQARKLAKMALNQSKPLQWTNYAHLDKLLWLMGGWPRGLQMLVQAIGHTHSAGCAFDVSALKSADLCARCLHLFVSRVSARYSFGRVGTELTSYLIAAHLLREPLDPDAPLPLSDGLPGGVNTLHKVAMHGLCNLVSANDEVRSGSPCDVCSPSQQAKGVRSEVQLPPYLLGYYAL